MADQIKKGSGTKTDRANFPTSPACGQWETLLVDALDGLLQPEDEAVFSSHMATCASCAEMFEQARRGREWLEFLAPEPEVPAHLLDKILAETGHGKLEAGKLVVAGGPSTGNVIPMTPAWQRPGFAGRMRRFAEPRLLMTAAMAFFSIALTLSLTGVRFSAIKMADLRPASLRFELEKRIMTASTPIVRYYDHLRFVYEVESRMRELRKATQNGQNGQDGTDGNPKSQPKNPQPNGEGQTHHKEGGSQLNPNDAPQQTVNPSASLWSGDTLEARLEPELRFAPPDQAQGRIISREMIEESKGSTTHTEESGSIETRVLAMPERSTSCVA
jgi:hypothetical protein